MEGENVKRYFESDHLKDLNRIGGESMEFEWKIFPGFTTFGLLEQIQKIVEDRLVNQSSSMAGSSSCQCSTTLYVEKKEMQRNVKNSRAVTNYARRFPRGHWSFLGPGSEKKWCGRCSDKPDGVCDKTAKDVVLEFAETTHPMFRASSALERGELRSKAGDKKTSFQCSEQNVELILRTINSANQLSVYGAVPDLCRELSKDTMASGKLEAHDLLETMDISNEPPTADPRADEQRR